MPKAQANGIELEYDTFGDSKNEAILLIMGMGAQMISWHPEFCTRLAEKGYFVIRFDNRDVGLSSKIEQAGVPDLMQLWQKYLNGEKINPPYTLKNMADDAVGLLTFLNLNKAHICGISLGSAIAQLIAIYHPERILSLTTMLGTSCEWDQLPPLEELAKAFITPDPKKIIQKLLIKQFLKLRREAWRPEIPFDEDYVKEHLAKNFDGIKRQKVATMVAEPRTEALKSVNVPTLVINGTADLIALVKGGEAIANAIPGAELLLIDGMGHDLPPKVWDQVINAMHRTAQKTHK